ncbi:alpha/beta hydrolase domain-containing protein [Dermatobacter hominis]|uniref:alpha/beta hydrolase domain-containing protein n=1 Tax=Dermatobacter hominis TaxID=2884263 RepID=UPI001D113790|nr:alpha/beta hydrolase domain-containing protein [Dermatobacter hominis]UDY35643.1 hypothetical protein LH044_20220 [Dermatobacter hominis]
MGTTDRVAPRRRTRTGPAALLVALVVASAACAPTSGGPPGGGTTPTVPLPPAATGAGVRQVRVDEVRPAFEGRSFGDVGRYERVRGTITGWVDPADPRNASITDLSRAPRNRLGFVEYEVDFVLLRPADPSKGNHRLIYEPSNRGNVVSLFFLNSAPPSNDLDQFVDAGNGFLMREGYSVLSVAWDPTVPDAKDQLQARYPVATNPDGSSIVGPALEEITYDDTTASHPLAYAAASLDTSRATLTVRTQYDDPPTVVPPSDWAYDDTGTAVHLLPEGTPFDQSALYELSYPAEDPLVVGLSFAVIRDVADFVRSSGADQLGNPNPLAGNARQVTTFCYSQPCRLMHDFVRLGFNETASGGRAVDGIESIVGGASGGFFNYRFAQPGRSMRQHIGRWYPERQFPFANQVTTDAVTGRTDGVHRRCALTDTCPKVFEINSETEYWNKAASLLTTDTRGDDLDLGATPNVRYYLLSSLPHAPSTGIGACREDQNPLLPDPVARALLVALDQWVANGTEPPANRVPRRRDGTLVPALPQSGVGFPVIPGVVYTGRTTTGDLFDFGSQFSAGVPTLPPAITPAAYPVFVPRTDADGNDVAGIRLPEISVPTATYSGWNVRAPGFAADDMCNATGQRIPFAATKADRRASGDPRLSIEERYPTHVGYVVKVALAAGKLQADRLLLAEDVRRYVIEALVSRTGT